MLLSPLFRIVSDSLKERPRPRKPDYLRESFDLAQLTKAANVLPTAPPKPFSTMSDSETLPRLSHPARVIKWGAIFIPTRGPLGKSRSCFLHLQGRNLFLLQMSQDILLETRMVRIFKCCLFSHLCFLCFIIMITLRAADKTQVNIFGKISPYQNFFKIMCYICFR